MHDPRAKEFRWLIWSVVAIGGTALFYVPVIDPSIVAIAAFAIGCLIAQRCAP